MKFLGWDYTFSSITTRDSKQKGQGDYFSLFSSENWFKVFIIFEKYFDY